MSLIEQRWTCPECSRTVVINASELDAHCCVIAVQLRHGKAHAAAAAVFERVGYPRRPKPIQRRRKAA